MRGLGRFVALLALVSVVGAGTSSRACAENAPQGFGELASEYTRDTLPIVKEFCLDCHSTAQREGELDLERFASFDDVRRDSKAWVRVVEMLDDAEMPPKDAEQPTSEEHARLRDWAARYLDAEALANAGDPGPVVLRRLNNAEYTYTVRELTGVDLDPAREFPADSAAGEGFTNAGNALVMSPGLLRKYLDAAKEIASHAVLLPEGFRFSVHSTQRDWTDELLAEIRAIYREYTDTSKLGVGDIVGNVNVHGNTRIGLASRLPLDRLFEATLVEREALESGSRSIESIARERGLSALYLETLWSMLNRDESSLLLDPLRSRWRNAGPKDAGELARAVAVWQQGLWTFGPVGLIGREGGPKSWMEPVTPLGAEHELRLALLPKNDRKKKDDSADPPADVVVSLVATDAGDGDEHDVVLWRNPRLVQKDKPDILLRDVREKAGDPSWGVDPKLFGKHPDGGTVDADSICVRVPSVIRVRLPGELAVGRELVMTAALDERAGAQGTAQVSLIKGEASAEPGFHPSQVVVRFSTVTQVFSDTRDVFHTRPVLVAENNPARQRFLTAFDDYRRLFPAALSYTQIVPVDEVLTLIRFYREDDHLMRLVLDDEERARLDRLWDELHYVSHSALQEEQGLELLLEAMTGNHQYKAVLPLYKPFKERAAKFRQQLRENEPTQMAALLIFAARAYRRPLSSVEADELRTVYDTLRDLSLIHI